MLYREVPKNGDKLPIPDLLEEVKEDMEGFMTKPMIWLIKRAMKVRKKDKV